MAVRVGLQIAIPGRGLYAVDAGYALSKGLSKQSNGRHRLCTARLADQPHTAHKCERHLASAVPSDCHTLCAFPYRIIAPGTPSPHISRAFHFPFPIRFNPFPSILTALPPMLLLTKTHTATCSSAIGSSNRSFTLPYSSTPNQTLAWFTLTLNPKPKTLNPNSSTILQYP